MSFDWANETSDSDPLEGYGEVVKEPPRTPVEGRSLVSVRYNGKEEVVLRAPVNQTELDRIVEGSPEPEESAGELSEVEYRLEKAQAYKALLGNQLLASESEAAIEVENEIQDFVRERLAFLMGMQKPSGPASVVELPFSADEIEILKALAARVLKKSEQITPTKVPVTVQPVKPATPKPAPAVKPVEVSTPTQRRGRGRPPKICDACGGEYRKCGGKHTATVSALFTPAPGPAPKVESPKTSRYETDSQGNEIRIDPDGRRYKKTLARDQRTSEIHEEWVDVTPPARPTNMTPYPDEAQVEALAAAQANQVLSKAPSYMGHYIAAALNTPAKEE